MRFHPSSAEVHRIVHGLARTEPARITPEVLAELHRAKPHAPDHLPREIELIEVAVLIGRRGALEGKSGRRAESAPRHTDYVWGR